jgi:hypothetical protein
MTTLERRQRQQLEKVIQEARDVAETAATAILNEYGVGEATAPAHLDDKAKDLRRRLRIHGRQLGDLRDSLSKTQETVRLKEEMAYEHWHRMLFARFLAENNLLMYPDENNPIPVTLEECDELAVEQGLNNGWEVAAHYAAKMLPQIFRLSSPVFELKLPKNRLRQLEQLLASLSQETFLASDSLGWVYQFWQAKRKDEVNASEVKIGARELPAVTQLFTEDYMVQFLLDNSLGAWWAAKRLGITDEGVGVEAESEAELRQRATIPGIPLEYLRFVQLENGTWIPAAGIFNKWPDSLSELKVMDPSCGSGHFLVAAFLMIVPMMEAIDSLTSPQAVDSILANNIYGLELDQRCVELAAFALALSAWTYPKAGGYRKLPQLNVACSGLAIAVAQEEWKELARGKQNLKLALEQVYEIFENAPVLGSLINPGKSEYASLVDWNDLSGTLKAALGKEQNTEQREATVVAQGISQAAMLLTDQYHLVITNVPYLARGKQDKVLQDYCEAYYPTGRNDLATVFLERCLEMCTIGGTASIVLPQNWLFLTSYRKFREKMLVENRWHMIARLGPKGFQTPMWDFNVQLISLSRGNSKRQHGDLFGENDSANTLSGIDVSAAHTVDKKAVSLQSDIIRNVSQVKQLSNPDARVMLEETEDVLLLNYYSSGIVGIQTGDFPQFGRYYWETLKDENWEFEASTPENTLHTSGKSYCIFWQNFEGELARRHQSGQAYVRGFQAFGRRGVLVSPMGNLPVTNYSGELFDNNSATIIPKNESNIPAIWCFCSSTDYVKAVRQIDQSLKVTNATLAKVPFDLDHWSRVAQEKYPNGIPKPYSNDPTQWIFHGHPSGSVIWDEGIKWTTNDKLRTDDTVLQVAAARLLGYRWPAELDPEMELADEQREWVDKCGELVPLTDEDGIVCIPSVRGEATAADRLLKILVKSYGDQWNNQILSDLLLSASAVGKTLDTWLRDYFFTQHNKLFKHRPFIWHIWDGLVDGFSVLVDYHKLDQKLLETLIYDYLGDWISRQKRDITQLIPGAEEKLAAAEVLKKRLELILAGEQPYDIFVRWKSLDQQCIGWDPDLNDGVRLNIRPFMSVPDIKKRGAGVLRDKPNIHWKKDRGKDVVTAPWFSLGPEYGGKEGDRINDHHLSLAEKNLASGKGNE